MASFYQADYKDAAKGANDGTEWCSAILT